MKFSHKGVIFKTWEGEIISDVSGLQSFNFSVQDKDQAIIEQLKDLQGKDVKVEYIERYKAFFWWGDTPIFITKVEQDNSLNMNESCLYPFTKPDKHAKIPSGAITD